MIHPPSVRPQPLDPNSGADSEMLEKLHASLGDFFAERIASDSEWARAILSDEASMITGSIGMIPSSSLGEGTRGLYEPIHGSAPDISGKGIANPIGTILSAAMLLRYSLGLNKPASAIEAAVRKVLDLPSAGGYGLRTADLGGKTSTVELGDKVVEALKQLL